MESNSRINNSYLSSKLKDCFKNNIKLALVNKESVFKITKNDIFYDINRKGSLIPLFISSIDSSILDQFIVKELCHKNIIELSYDFDYESYFHFAITNDKKIYYWVMGYDNWDRLGNAKCEGFVKPELN
jgi:hypothetical protein